MVNQNKINKILSIKKEIEKIYEREQKQEQVLTAQLNKYFSKYNNIKVSSVSVINHFPDKYYTLNFEVFYEEGGSPKFGHDFRISYSDNDKIRITTGTMRSQEETYLYFQYVYGMICKDVLEKKLQEYISKIKQFECIILFEETIRKLNREETILYNELAEQSSKELVLEVGKEYNFNGEIYKIEKMTKLRLYFTTKHSNHLQHMSLTYAKQDVVRRMIEDALKQGV